MPETSNMIDMETFFIFVVYRCTGAYLCITYPVKSAAYVILRSPYSRLLQVGLLLESEHTCSF